MFHYNFFIIIVNSTAFESGLCINTFMSRYGSKRDLRKLNYNIYELTNKYKINDIKKLSFVIFVDFNFKVN